MSCPWYKRVYLSPYKVADTPFYIQGSDVYIITFESVKYNPWNEIFTLRNKLKKKVLTPTSLSLWCMFIADLQ